MSDGISDMHREMEIDDMNRDFLQSLLDAALSGEEDASKVPLRFTNMVYHLIGADNRGADLVSATSLFLKKLKAGDKEAWSKFVLLWSRRMSTSGVEWDALINLSPFRGKVVADISSFVEARLPHSIFEDGCPANGLLVFEAKNVEVLEVKRERIF